MDAKNIFIACQHHKGLIEWKRTGDTEWHYIGVEDDYKENMVAELINNHFTAQVIYLVIDRHNAYEIDIQRAAPTIGRLLKTGDLTLSNKDFSKMMVFNRIGVVKMGISSVRP